jgi:hypothetical protein
LALAKDSPLTRSVQAIDSILPLPVLGGCAAADQLALGQSGAPPGATCDIDATCRLKYPRNQRLKAEIRSGRNDGAIRRATIQELVPYLSKDLRDEAADLFRAAAFQFVCRYEETINRVADALAERLSLSNAEIDAMMPASWTAGHTPPAAASRIRVSNARPQAPIPAGKWRRLAEELGSRGQQAQQPQPRAGSKRFP